MTNAAIAAALARIADLLEGERQNPFRIKAYRRAARSLERHDRQVGDMLRDGEGLTAIPGVGSELSRLIEELATTGRAPLLEELEARAPAAPARRRRRGAPLEDRAIRLTQAEELAAALRAFLAGTPAAQEVEVTGEVRRKLDRVERVELLVASGDPAAVMDRLAAHAGLEELVVDGAHAAARLRGALPIAVTVVPPARWGTALVEATGPPAHARAVRARVPRAAHRTEEGVYRAAGLPFIPPELRGGGAELERPVPPLVEVEAIRGDLQMHTDWSDGRSGVAQMAAACRRRGYEYLAITDHSGSLAIAHGLSPERLERQWREIDEVRAARPGIVILRSMEVDVLPDGALDLPEAHLRELDCVLVAVHVQQKLPRAQQTARILRAVEHPAVDILGHPTGRRGRRPSYDVDLDAVLRACAQLGVAVELDCSPDRNDLSAENVRRALDLGCVVVIDTDAHSQRELQHMGFGVGQARRAAAGPADILNARRWPDLRRWLQRRGGRRALDALG
jgi:DNA polymerase (family 10)